LAGTFILSSGRKRAISLCELKRDYAGWRRRVPPHGAPANSPETGAEGARVRWMLRCTTGDRARKRGSCLPDKRETREQGLSDRTLRTQKGERNRERDSKRKEEPKRRPREREREACVSLGKRWLFF
jgi:hypothetical protein